MTLGIKQLIALKPNTAYTISALVSSGSSATTPPAALSINASFAGNITTIANSTFQSAGGTIASITVTGMPDFAVTLNTLSQAISVTPIVSTFVGTDSGSYSITDTFGQTSNLATISITRTSTVVPATNVFTVNCAFCGFNANDQVTLNYIGTTAHTDVYIDPVSFSANMATATNIANFVIANIETAYTTLNGWFGGTGIHQSGQASATQQDPSGAKINILIYKTMCGGNAGRHCTGQFGDLYIGADPNLTGEGSFFPTILEFSECFMLNYPTATDTGTGTSAPWYPGDSLGEALSIIAAEETIPTGAPKFFNGSTAVWLNNLDPNFNVIRHDYSTGPRSTDSDPYAIGFGMSFLYWLRYKVGKTYAQIVQAGDTSWQQICSNLAVSNTFIADVQAILPAGTTYNLNVLNPDGPDNIWSINTNLVSDCSNLTTTNWTKFGTPTIGATLVSDPDGGTNAQVATFPTARSGFNHALTLTASTSYTATIFYHAPPSGVTTPFYLGYYNGTSSITQFSALLTASASWTRSADFTFTTGTADATPTIVVVNTNLDSGTGIAGSVELYGLKVEAGNSSSAFNGCAGAAPGPVAGGLSYMVGYIDKDNSGAHADAVATWLGRPLDVVGSTYTFTNVNSYTYNSKYLVNARVPLTDLYAGTGESSMSAAAAGTYNYRYTNMANSAAGNAAKTCAVAPGWEMNGYWYPWCASGPNNPGTNTHAQYIAAFKNCAAIFKAKIPHIKIEWCTNIAFGDNQYGTGNPQDYWPGKYDPVTNPGGADVVTMDFYQANVGSSFSSASTSGTYNLTWALNFAKTNGCLFGLSEWGAGQNTNDGTYVTNAINFMNNAGTTAAWCIWSQYSPADQLWTAGAFPNEQNAWISAWRSTHFAGTWWLG